LTVGGAEVLAARLARKNRERYRFVFACLDELGELGRQLDREGFPIAVFERRQGFDVRCVLRLASFFRQHDVELIHAHQYTPFFYAALARNLAGGTPILFTEHGRFFPDYRRPKRVFANKFLLRRRDRVVAVGEAVKQALIDNEGIAAERIRVIYNGVDPSEFTSETVDRQQVRSSLGLGADDFVVIQVARLDPIKDHATALRAMGRVVNQCKRARLLIVGDGPERGSIERQLAAAGLNERVKMLGTRSDVRELLAAADCFLLTSVSEGIPVTLIEAMFARLPVAATNVGGIGEVVVNGTTGILAPAGDDAALAKAIRELANCPDRRQSLGVAGFTRARDLFSEAAMHQQYRAVFDELFDVRR
jgi:glycosyltransferase involved in cell wall biosynthesis